MRARGKKLWIQFQDVSFNPNRNHAPKYLLNEPQFNGGADKQYQIKGDDEAQAVHEGWMVRRWDPAVQERLHKLFAALGKEFDGQVEGINTEETSSGHGWTGKLFPKGYTHEIYRDAIITNMKALKRAFPKSIAMIYANFMPGGRPHLEAVYKAARESNVAAGGPDLLPFRPFQRANSYPLIRESAGTVPTGLAVQDGNYSDVNRETGKRATVAELLKFGTEYLKLDYIFWCTEEPYYSNELIPFMRAAKRVSLYTLGKHVVQLGKRSCVGEGGKRSARMDFCCGRDESGPRRASECASHRDRAASMGRRFTNDVMERLLA